MYLKYASGEAGSSHLGHMAVSITCGSVLWVSIEEERYYGVYMMAPDCCKPPYTEQRLTGCIPPNSKPGKRFHVEATLCLARGVHRSHRLWGLEYTTYLVGGVLESQGNEV